MDNVDLPLDNPLGILLIAVGVFVVFKALKTVVKLAMLIVIAAGLYLLVNR
jgi:hypothetical protein